MRIEAAFATSKASRRLLHVLGHDHAYFVGGCVRNLLLGVAVEDIDLATDLPPDEVISRAEGAGLRVIPTGLDHGTVTIISEKQSFEVTSFRRDIKTDGRRAVVNFTTSIHEDAARRDFTINALYLSADGHLKDPTGEGLRDLERRQIRFIGSAKARIKEDALRILRFFRFSAHFGKGGLDRDGLSACKENIALIPKLSKERIGVEFRKLLLAKDPYYALCEMHEIGALALILPKVQLSYLQKLIAVEKEFEVDLMSRLYALGGADLKSALRLSNPEAKRLAKIEAAEKDQTALHALAYREGAELAMILLKLRHATSKFGDLNAEREMIEKGRMAHFPITAHDLEPLSGPALGDALRRLEAAWIKSSFAYNREDLLNLL